jgi:hypothetical protein
LQLPCELTGDEISESTGKNAEMEGEPFAVEPQVDASTVDGAEAVSGDTEPQPSPEASSKPSVATETFQVEIEAGADVLGNLFKSEPEEERPFVPAPSDDGVKSVIVDADEGDVPFVPVVEDADSAEAADGSEHSASAQACVPAIPDEPDSEQETEPFGAGLDLSRLKTAMSALDANFASKYVPVEDGPGVSDKPQSDGDMAAAIKAAYGAASSA